MNNVLLRKLIEKGFFNDKTEIDASYRCIDVSGVPLGENRGTFTVLSYGLVGDNEVAIEGANIVDGKRRILMGSAISAISGMDPERYAASCGLNKDGEKVQEGKRRGRKPKPRPGIIEAPLDLDDEDDEDDDEDENFDAEIFETSGDK